LRHAARHAAHRSQIGELGRSRRNTLWINNRAMLHLVAFQRKRDRDGAKRGAARGGLCALSPKR